MVIKYLLVAGVSAGVGYYVGQSRLRNYYIRETTRKTDDARYFYKDKYEKAMDAFKDYSGTVPEPSSAEDKPVEVDDSENTEEENISAVRKHLLRKTPQQSLPTNYNAISTPSKIAETPPEPEDDEVDSQISLITQQSFIGNEFDYKQFSFTYFAGDGILANESDEPVTNAAREVSIGKEALYLLQGGPKAMGGDSIYVRNHAGKWEFDITYSAGEYTKEVVPIETDNTG